MEESGFGCGLFQVTSRLEQPAPGQTLSATCLGPTLLGLWRSECALKHGVWKEQVLESRVVLSLLCRGVKESIRTQYTVTE